MQSFWAILTCIIVFVQNIFTFGAYKDAFDRSAAALRDKDEILASTYAGEESGVTFDPSGEFDPDSVFTVEKQEGRDFVILNITDTHFSDYDYRTFYAFDAERHIKKLVKQYSPDLITVTGDIVCGESAKSAIERVTALFDSFGIPWAPVYGNHDDETNCDLNYLSDVMMSSEYCLFDKNDPAMGNGNYIINVTENGSVVETIFMMDSHHTQLNTTQVSWYQWAVDGLESAGKLGELSVFFHIPLPEYQYAFDAAWDADNKQWRDGFDAAGECNEKICCERDSEGKPVQRGVFDALKNAGTDYIFCGHEHMNDFSIMYEGVRLTYCLKVDKGSGYQPGFDGGTLITIGDNGIKNITHRTLAGVDRDLVDINTADGSVKEGC